jgi:ureidoglycolate lyase
MNSVMTAQPSAVAVQPMTAEAYAPYGLLLDRPARPSDIHQRSLDYWHELVEAHFPGRPVWGWLETRQRPFVLAQMERHNRSDEVFIATGGRAVMPFALGGRLNDPSAQPDPATLAFFIVDAAQAFLVPKGVWHAPGFPLDAAAQYLILLEAFIPSSDIDTRPVGPFRFDSGTELNPTPQFPNQSNPA